MKVDETVAISPPSTSTICLSDVGGLALKRTATEAFLSDANTTPTANTDHAYYACKESPKKRPKLSEAATSDDESDSAPPKSVEEKYRTRRDKNNVASKRSRETRKQKYVYMEEKATELEKSNASLKVKIEQLEALTKQMKEALVQRLANK